MNVFSTCWNSHRHEDGYALCQEIWDLGFRVIELSHGLSLRLMPGIIKAQESGLIRVAGVHNFCPAPLGITGDCPDCYEFTSHREWERERALQLSQQSIAWAAKLGARYVVLHLGHVHLLHAKAATLQLEAAAKAGKVGTQEYARQKNSIMAKRARLAPLYYERARLALHQLADEARSCGISLGVECRSHLEQIPNEVELDALMLEFKDCPYVGYWHDFGHAQRKHNLLQLNHEQQLKKLKAKLIGAHINDLRWPARDHQCPFTGSRRGGVDLDQLLPAFFTADMPLSWELSHHAPSKKIRQALLKWESLSTKLKIK